MDQLKLCKWPAVLCLSPFAFLLFTVKILQLALFFHVVCQEYFEVISQELMRELAKIKREREEEEEAKKAWSSCVRMQVCGCVFTLFFCEDTKWYHMVIVAAIASGQ